MASYSLGKSLIMRDQICGQLKSDHLHPIWSVFGSLLSGLLWNHAHLWKVTRDPKTSKLGTCNPASKLRWQKTRSRWNSHIQWSVTGVRLSRGSWPILGNSHTRAISPYLGGVFGQKKSGQLGAGIKTIRSASVGDGYYHTPCQRMQTYQT